MSPLRSSAGPAVCDERNIELGGDDLGERGLAEARRARRAARGRAPRRAPIAASIATASCSLSCSWPTNSSRRRGRSVRSRSSSASQVRRLDPLGDVLMRPRLAVARSACASSSSALSPRRQASSCSASAARSRARAALRAPAPRGASCGGARAGRADAGLRRRADLLAQLDDDPLGGALADPGHGLEARGVAGRDRAHQVARGAAGSTASATFGPTACTAEQHQEEVALLLGGEAVERERVVAHDQVRVQRRPCRRPAARGAASAPRPTAR